MIRGIPTIGPDESSTTAFWIGTPGSSTNEVMRITGSTIAMQGSSYIAITDHNGPIYIRNFSYISGTNTPDPNFSETIHFNVNNNSYGAVMPNMYSWTSSKTVAMVEDIPTISGSYSGSYWTELTIDGTTKELGAGGSSLSIDNKTIVQGLSGIETAIGGWKEAGTITSILNSSTIVSTGGTTVDMTQQDHKSLADLCEELFGADRQQFDVIQVNTCDILLNNNNICTGNNYIHY